MREERAREAHETVGTGHKYIPRSENFSLLMQAGNLRSWDISTLETMIRGIEVAIADIAL